MPPLLWAWHVGAQQKQLYLAMDNHTDYYWSGNAAAYDSVAVREIDFYLDLADSTQMLALPYQNRYNLDGAWYVEAYRRQKSSAEFNRLIQRIKTGHISVPYNYMVSTYGGQPTEAVLRGMYWSGKLERDFNLDIKLASSMENHTHPLGLGSLWAGAGAKYSWKGVCGCDTPVSPVAMANRNHEIYRYQGLDSMGVLMKWYSLASDPPGAGDLGTYYEASRVVPAVNHLMDKCNTPAYPYHIAGAFGTGADFLETLYDYYPSLAVFLSNDERQIHLSNEYDFFEHFESEYDTRQLPAETVTYGNDWDTGCTALATPTANMRRAVEKLRSAEALAALATIADTSFYGRFESLREQTWIALGSYWEHGFLGGGCCLAERGPWAIGLQEQVSQYVDSLHLTALNVLAGQIANPDSSARFFVFNPLGQVRTDYADIPYPFGSTDIRIVEVAGGTEVPHQVLSDGESNYLRILAADVPAAGYKVYELQLEPGADWPPAATLEGDVFENDFYSLTVTPGGAITSLIDKVNGQTEYVQPINGRYLNDFGQGAGFNGTLELLSSGPVSATLACTSPLPLPHTTLITLYRDINRIDILNRINSEFGDSVRTYSFSFDLGGAPSTWHEELGAVIKAKYTTNDGHYAPPGQPIRHEWQTLNHFADIGDDAKGVTLSNLGAAFMKLGNSQVDFLDEDASQINVLIGGKIYGAGFENQLGATEFVNAFSLRTRATPFSAVESMKFALEHQNPLIAAPVGNEAGTLPDSSFSLLRIDNPNVLLWALKPAEEDSDQRGIALRFWNLSRQAEEYTADFAYQVLDARQATHLETDMASAPVEQGNLLLLTGQQKMETYRVFLGPDIYCASNITVQANICPGENFEGYTMSGTYVDTFALTGGCDSIRTLVLEVASEVPDTLNRSICEGESFEGYSMSGTYTDTLTTSAGCDSVRILILEVLPGATNAIDQTICQGENFEGYTMSGTYIDTLTAANGCDSVRTLVLEVLPGAANSIDQTICQGENFEGYTMSGTYIDTLTAANGCDSVRTLVLEVLPAIDTVRVMFTTCDLSAIGTQTATLTAANGCDSTVVYTTTFVPFLLNLEITPATPGMSDGTATAMLSGGTPPFNYLWSTGATGPSISGLAPGLYSLTVSEADGCTVVSGFEVLQASSVEHIATLLSMKVYPNPVSERLMVELNFGKAERGMCLLYDYIGRVVHREAFYGSVFYTEIDSRQLPGGVYLLSVLFSDQQATRHIVVQHR